MDWKKLLGAITASVDEEFRLRNAYLAVENRILRQQLPGRIQLCDSDRTALAEIGKQLSRKALVEVATIVQPDTILQNVLKEVKEKGTEITAGVR